MAELDLMNVAVNPADEQVSLASISNMREAFENWINDGNTEKYSPEVVLSCLDRISEYAVRKKISSISIWGYTQFSAFQTMYNRLLGVKLLRVTDRNTYKVFVVGGQLYLRFLKEKLVAHKKDVATVTEDKGAEPAIVTEHSTQKDITPDDVVAWLVTQPNANGTLYLENVVRQYMRALRTAPAKLEISVAGNDRNVFTCRTPDELNVNWDIFKAAPNYNQVNSSMSGMFSAGMGCYLRYLEYHDVTSVVPIVETEDRKLVTDNRQISFVNAVSIDNDTSAAINQVLAEKFTNGFRYSNGIEIGRLRRFTKERLGKEVMLDDNDIVSYVRAQGTEFAGKIYVISKDTKEHIYQLAKDYFRCGAAAIFYAEFYARHESWLFEASIVSEEMLIEVLRADFRNFSFTQTFFGQINDSVYNVLQNEILRVWGDDILLTYEILAERLTYIPQFRIEQHLGQTNDFIWNAKGEFTHISKVDIAEHEKREIAHYIESEIRIHGYASISDVSLGEIFDRNYELSITAIHNAVYFICLADKYAKNGKIITRKGDNIDALHIIKEHCKTLDRCTLDNLLNFERDLTGECHRWIPMQAGYDVLVRTDENAYVAERYIHFDKAAIDMAIEYFLQGGEYIPLQSVTTFAMLPHCGQAWNLFILESYCRRFSDNFRFECLSVNSKNAGAIVRKKSRLSYADIMADAVAKSDVSLVAQPVLNFLVENGYISVRRYTKVTELINQAKAIRNK
ncbi:MAG: hypothetical protein FNP40_15725 [Dehalobacter sp. 4CP]|uniref:hypothetical protein n=1 Tax=Dehalobacter sp. CP TaxID=2594474 RepID=UPI0013C788E3|nr:hypothetical protein [Dehalobacter sp. 4CP]